MGLINKLKTNGSVYSKYNGADPVIEDKKQSKLHKEYSINGEPLLNGLPNPSEYDLNGVPPSTPNRDGNYTPINNSFEHGTYINSAPTEGIGRI